MLYFESENELKFYNLAAGSTNEIESHAADINVSSLSSMRSRDIR